MDTETGSMKNILLVVLSSSRKMPDLIECYRRGVNAYVVKPVNFAEFMKAVKQLGIFWAAINEPPPTGREKTSISNGAVSPSRTEGREE